jgi:hypothetical protein
MDESGSEESEKGPVFENTEPSPKQIRVARAKTPNPLVESLSQRLFEGEDIAIVPSDQVSSVIKYLTHYRDVEIDAHHVDEAERADKFATSLAKHQLNSTTQSIRESRGSHMSDLLEAAQRRLSNLEQRYAATYDAILAENEEHLSQLREKHQQEREEFEASWSTPTKTRPYTRASQQLIQLRTRSVLLMKARRYDDHRVTEKAVDDLERDETAERHWRMEQEFDAQSKLLDERHKEELNRQMVSNESRICAFTRAREREITAAKKRVGNVEADIKALEESEKMRSNPRNNQDPIVPQSRIGPRSKALDMKEICQLRLPPLNTKVRGKVSQSTPVKRPS